MVKLLGFKPASLHWDGWGSACTTDTMQGWATKQPAGPIAIPSTTLLHCVFASVLQSELDITLNQFDCGMDGTQDLQVEVVDEVSWNAAHMHHKPG